MANTATAIYVPSSTGNYIDTGFNPTIFKDGDFTIEFWVYNYNNHILNSYGGSPSTHGIYCISGFGGTWYINGTTGNAGIANGLVASQTRWQHAAYVRNGDTVRSFKDGKLVATNSANFGNLGPTGNINLGRGGDGDTGTDGQFAGLDGFRISHGALYGNIDVPTTQLKTWQNAGRGQNTLLPHHTKLLIQANSTTTTSSTIYDQSASGHSITASGVVHSQTKTNFGNTAIFFDGSNDYIGIQHHADFEFGVGDFSVEMWINPSVTSGGDGYGLFTLRFNTGGSPSHWSMLTSRLDAGNWQITAAHGTAQNTGTMDVGLWHHLALARVHGVIYYWKDGRLVGRYDAGTTALGTTSGIEARIGSFYDARYYSGYMDGIRICKGQAAYTPNFTPYGGQKNVAYVSGGAVSQNRHASANTHAIRMGQAVNATNANTYCLDFDGTADYLTHNAPTYRSSDDRGTVFAWIYPDSGTNDVIIASCDHASADYMWILYIDGSGKLRIETDDNTNARDYATSASVGTGGWHSVAWVSTGSAWTVYIDGTAAAFNSPSGTNVGTWLGDIANRDSVTIGAVKYSSTTNYFDGKIMQVAYWGGASGTTGVLDADAIAALHAAGKGYDIKGSGNTGNYDSWADDLKGYWRMGNHYLDSAGNAVIHDASGNGADMSSVSVPNCETWITGTTFLEGWQDRGYFTGDEYTAFLIQSAHANGSTTFTDSGPGFKRTNHDGTSYLNVNTGSPNQYRKDDVTGSISFWTRWSNTFSGGTADTIFGAFQSSDYFYLGVRANDLYLDYRDDGTDNSRSDGPTASGLTQGIWNHVVITQSGVVGDANPIKFYINGDYVAWQPSRTNKPLHQVWFGTFDATNFTLGGWLNTGGSFTDAYKGQFSQFAVWGGTLGASGAELSASDVAAIYALGPNGNVKTSYSTGLVDYWTMGNLTGEGTDTNTTIYSQVSGGVDLTGVSVPSSQPFSGTSVDATGGAHHSAKGVFSGSAIYLDGTDDKLTVGAQAGLVYGTGDFTVDFWMNCSRQQHGNEGIFWNANGTDNNSECLRISLISSPSVSYIEYRLVDQGASSNEINLYSGKGSGVNLDKETWYHIACCRVNGVAQLWQDGILQDQNTSAHNHTWGMTEGIKIGLQRGTNYYQGYLDEIRFSVGISRYSNSIERYANTFVEKGDTGDAFTVLQVQSNGARGGEVFSAGRNQTGSATIGATVIGNPRWVTTGGDPLGGGNTALYFSGSDYITFDDTSIGEFGDDVHPNEFTIELWAKVIGGSFGASSTSSDRMGLISRRTAGQSGSGTGGWGVTIIGGELQLTAHIGSWGSGSGTHLGAPYPVDGGWHHIAFTRNQAANGVYAFFVDGRLGGMFGSGTTEQMRGQAGDKVCLGENSHSGTDTNSRYEGYMDQIRISKVIRYGRNLLRTAQLTHTSANSDSGVITSNSTFGTANNIFTADAYTALLLQGDGTGFAGTAGDTFTDESASPGLGAKTVTNNGGILLRQGVSAFGANSYYFDGTNSDSLSIPASADFSMDGDFTYEMWAKADVAIASQTDLMLSYYNHGGSPQNGVQVNAFSNGSCAFYHSDGSEGWGAVTNPNNNFKDGNWHHLAIQRKDNTFSIWIDGQGTDREKVYGTIGRSTTDVMYIGNNGGGTEAWHGFMDGIRISKGIARYGYTGTNTKLGLNAIHPSHCKLLITSNTYSGSTHFDDLSDQGNYWNQTPENYHFHGADSRIDCGDPNWTSDLSDGFSVCAWLKPDPVGTAYIASQREDSSNREWGFYIGSTGTLSARFFSSASSYMTFDGTVVPIVEGQWNLIAMTFDGTNSTSSCKLYGNGNDVSVTGVDSNSFSGTLATTNANFVIGWREEYTAQEFIGGMAQVVMWGDVKTLANINAMWEAGPTANMTTSFGSNMLGYWTMGNHNDLAGGRADTAAKCYDRSGNNNDGTPTGGTWYAPNKGHLIKPSGDSKHIAEGWGNFGSTAIKFDGTGDKLEIPDSSGFQFGKGNFTIEFWINKDSSTYGNHEGIISRYWNQSPYQQSWMVTFKNDSKIYFMYDNGSATDATGEVSVFAKLFTDYDDQWTHVIVQRNTVNLQLYLNGIIVSKDNGVGTATIADGDTPLIIGGYRDYITGKYKLDEIAIYKGVAKYTPVAFPGKETQTPSYLDDPTGNHLTTSGVVTTDQMIDTPENNFCTLNPAMTSKQMSGTNFSSMAFTFTEGNLKMSVNGSQWGAVSGTLGVSSGKWYFENENSSSANHTVGWAKAGFEMIGMSVTGGAGQGFADVSTADVALGFKVGQSGTGYRFMDGPTTDYVPSTTLAAPPANYVGTIGIAIDLDNGKFYASHLGNWIAGQDPDNGQTINDIAEFTPGEGHWVPMCSMADNGVWQKFNFGQGDGDGYNNFTDDRGRGGFKYKPPTGFLALCTANMKDNDYAPLGPMSAKGTPDRHFDMVLYTGTGGYGNRVKGLNFKPDLVWIKTRNNAGNHVMQDTLRGVKSQLYPHETTAEGTNVNSITEFNQDGFTLGDEGHINGGTDTGVAWCWKAGNGTVENSDGDLTCIVSANPEAGFSIISFDNRATDFTNYTLGHGLDKAPEFVLVKNRGKSSQFAAWHKDLTGNYYLAINDTDAETNYSGYFPSGGMTATTIKLGSDDDVSGQSNGPGIIYAWHSVEGFSKFGKYRGNGSTDGAFVYTGFKPAMIIVKKNADEGWWMIDHKCNPHNCMVNSLAPHNDAAERTDLIDVDFVSNGFKLRGTDSAQNSSGVNYFYMAWAEMPFKYATAR